MTVDGGCTSCIDSLVNKWQGRISSLVLRLQLQEGFPSLTFWHAQ